MSDLFLNYGKTPQQKELFRKASGIANFIPTDNHVLEPVSGFKFATERGQIEGNAALTHEQKAIAIKRIDARAERFKQAVQASP